MAEVHAPALARRLGVSDRHLRRVFGAEFGVSPVQYAQTQRLLLAKRLLTDTSIPVTEVALASGFASVRRFNALFGERYRMAPSRLRAAPDAGADAARAPSALRFELAYRPPYDWDGVLGFLAQRTVAGVESVTASAYRRVVRVDGPAGESVGWIEVEHRPRRRTLRVSLAPTLARVVPQVLARVKRVFDTDCRPDEIAAVLGEIAAGRAGVRVPGAFDGFEMAVRAILGQQVSVRAAHTLAGRIARRFGQPVETGIDGLDTAFPSAERIARLAVGDIASLGIVAQRARALLALAGAVAERRVVLEAGADVDATIATLNSLPGIGDWTAQYVAMRALSWPDAFPASDLGVLKALGVPGARRAQALSQRWRPWRAYAVMMLWRSLPPAPGRSAPGQSAPGQDAPGQGEPGERVSTGARRRTKAPA